MTPEPQPDASAPAPVQRAAGRRRAAAKRGAWASSAVVSLAVHAGALGVVGLLALVPRHERQEEAKVDDMILK